MTKDGAEHRAGGGLDGSGRGCSGMASEVWTKSESGCVPIRGKNILDEGNSKCKSPESRHP